MKVVQRKTDGTVQLASKQLKGHVCPRANMQMQMNSLIHNTQTCFITAQTRTAAAAATSHMNIVMCTLNHAQDKQTEFTLVFMKSLCYCYYPLRHFSHSSHKQSLRQAVLSLMTGLICSCCKMDMLESASGLKSVSPLPSAAS